MDAPAVSVVIPTYNRPHLVGRAIQSVINQTHQDFEVIVVDDGLKERAEAAVVQFNDERIRYVTHKENKGCSAAKNTGIREANGRFVAFLDDDDEWLPEKLERQVGKLEGTPKDVGYSFHAAIEMFDERIGITEVPDGVGDYLDFALRKFSGMIDSSMMYKSEVFKEVGFLDESLPTHTGADFAIRVARAFRGLGINEPLVRREIRSDHVQMGSNIKNRIIGREEILRRYCDEFKTRPAYLAKHLEQLARFYRDDQQYREASRCFWHSFRLQPRLGRFIHTLVPRLKRSQNI